MIRIKQQDPLGSLYRKPWDGLIFISIVWLCFFLLRLSEPPNLREYDQERPASYIMDVVQNGKWICQHDFNDTIASKPPLYTWLATLSTVPFERINRFAICFPNGLAILITSYIIFVLGNKIFGRNGGFFAALLYILSAPVLKQLSLCRTDPLFTLFTVLTAVLLYRVWVQKKGWIWFWLGSAAATLTKGPLGILIAAGGMLAYFWEKKDGNQQSFGGNFLPGLLFFLFITLGWFFLAYANCGKEFIDKILFDELVGHAVGGYKNKIPLVGFYKPAFYFITRFFPWSILAFMGFWKIWKRPSQDLCIRSAERFLICYFFFGLLLFSLASHQRSDLIFPLLPAASMVAGKVLSEHFQIRNKKSLFFRTATAVCVVFIVVAVYSFVFKSQDKNVQMTSRLKDAAKQLDMILDPRVRIEYLNMYYTLQFYRNTLQPLITLEESVRLMASPEPIYIVTRPLAKENIKQYLGDIPYHVVLQTKDVMVVSNNPSAQIKAP